MGNINSSKNDNYEQTILPTNQKTLSSIKTKILRPSVQTLEKKGISWRNFISIHLWFNTTNVHFTPLSSIYGPMSYKTPFEWKCVHDTNCENKQINLYDEGHISISLANEDWVEPKYISIWSSEDNKLISHQIFKQDVESLNQEPDLSIYLYNLSINDIANVIKNCELISSNPQLNQLKKLGINNFTNSATFIATLLSEGGLEFPNDLLQVNIHSIADILQKAFEKENLSEN